MSADHPFLTLAKSPGNAQALAETLRCRFIGGALCMLKHSGDYTREQMRDEAVAFELAEAILRRRMDEDKAWVEDRMSAISAALEFHDKYRKGGDGPCAPRSSPSPSAPADGTGSGGNPEGARSTPSASDGAAPHATESAPTALDPYPVDDWPNSKMETIPHPFMPLGEYSTTCRACCLGPKHSIHAPQHDPANLVPAILAAATGGAK